MKDISKVNIKVKLNNHKVSSNFCVNGDDVKADELLSWFLSLLPALGYTDKAIQEAIKGEIIDNQV